MDHNTSTRHDTIVVQPLTLVPRPVLANIKKQTANELGCLKYDITRTGDVFTLSELYQDQNAVTGE